MSTKLEIDQAIGAHGMWKTRLKKAIESGKLDTPVETIRMDNQCKFGQWLYNANISPVDKVTSHYKAVKELHAEFHNIAACVVELALAGKKADAEQMMGLGGKYAVVSATLTKTMMDWKDTLK